MSPGLPFARLGKLGAAGALSAGLWTLSVFPPERFSFYPRCPIHDFTGLLCPGCGATRAVAALLHGHLLQALDLNALVVVLLPATVLWALSPAGRRRSLPVPAIAVLLALCAAFTVVRNLA